MSAPIVGIDLGTTFSAIAVVNRYGFPEVISNRDGEDITPSVVLFDGPRTVVGSSAKRGGTANPLDVVQFVKRQMGVPHWTFMAGTGQRYSAEEVSALILKRLREDAETKLGVPIRDAVITVPAYFDDAQRKATQDAGRIAGLNVLRIINEPTAAALAYGVDKAMEKQTLLVYDLGGGTFDVTVMRIESGMIDVIATGGDKNLGGFDWDNLLMMFLNEQVMAAGGPDLFDDPAAEQDLRDKAEICKKNLSSLDRTAVHFHANGHAVAVEVTLDIFQELSQPLNERTARIVGFVLDDAKLKPEQIDKVLEKVLLGAEGDAVRLVRQGVVSAQGSATLIDRAYKHHLALLNLTTAATEDQIRSALATEQRRWMEKTNSTSIELKQEAERRIHALDQAAKVLLGSEGATFRRTGGRTIPTVDSATPAVDAETIARAIERVTVARGAKSQERDGTAVRKSSTVFYKGVDYRMEEFIHKKFESIKDTRVLTARRGGVKLFEWFLSPIEPAGQPSVRVNTAGSWVNEIVTLNATLQAR